MEFEYDPAKSTKNLAKHGIDFDEAQRLWDEDVVTLSTKPGTDEVRFLNVGIIGGKHWVAITTPRGNATRLISVRRARDYEVELYEQAIQG